MGRVPYIIGLLRKGLGVPESRIQVGSGREPWTLGAALAEGSKVGAGGAGGNPVVSRLGATLVALALYLCWLLFLGWTLRRVRPLLPHCETSCGAIESARSIVLTSSRGCPRPHGDHCDSKCNKGLVPMAEWPFARPEDTVALPHRAKCISHHSTGLPVDWGSKRASKEFGVERV